MRGADSVVVVVGNDPLINGRETQDRATLALPPQQQRLVEAACAVHQRVVLLVMSSYPYADLGADSTGGPRSTGRSSRESTDLSGRQSADDLSDGQSAGRSAAGNLARSELARRAARQAIVLLKNDNGVLPIMPRPGFRIAVVGPLADRLCEDWSSGTMPYQITVADGLREALRPLGGHVACAEGVDRVALREIGRASCRERVFSSV